jgi:hypothetical protein
MGQSGGGVPQSFLGYGSTRLEPKTGCTVPGSAAPGLRGGWFLVWSRLPVSDVLEGGDGYTGRFRDARFREVDVGVDVDRGSVGGMTVTLDCELRRPR